MDLTPLLPGGENGGAKAFALTLVRHLALAAPSTRFVLLTQAASHSELAALDAPNVSRVQVVGARAASARPGLLRAASRALAPFPVALRRLAGSLGYRLHAASKRRGARGVLRKSGAALLFCPFTAPTYREAGIPAVCTLYDLQHRAYPQFFSVEEVALREGAFQDACREAAALAAISEFSRAAALQAVNLDAARICAIALRLAAPSHVDAAAAMARLGLARGRYLLYPANFWRHKNHEMLLAAFGMACAAGLAADLKLVCTGEPGERQQWLAQAAARGGEAQRVVFAGYLPEDELRGLMAGARGVVFPSLYEGFGLPLIEAMALGVPVACGNATALPEVAGGAALLFDARLPGEIAAAIRKLDEDPALRARLVEAGLARAAEFSDAGRMAREYLELFHSVTAARG